MNVGSIAQLSTSMASQRIAAEHQVATVKMANDQIKLEGQAVMKLLQAVPQPSAAIGGNINVSV